MVQISGTVNEWQVLRDAAALSGKVKPDTLGKLAKEALKNVGNDTVNLKNTMKGLEAKSKLVDKMLAKGFSMEKILKYIDNKIKAENANKATQKIFQKLVKSNQKSKTSQAGKTFAKSVKDFIKNNGIKGTLKNALNTLTKTIQKHPIGAVVITGLAALGLALAITSKKDKTEN